MAAAAAQKLKVTSTELGRDFVFMRQPCGKEPNPSTQEGYHIRLRTAVVGFLFLSARSKDRFD